MTGKVKPRGQIFLSVSIGPGLRKPLAFAGKKLARKTKNATEI
jgi:hypothetical protein